MKSCHVKFLISIIPILIICLIPSIAWANTNMLSGVNPPSACRVAAVLSLDQFAIGLPIAAGVGFSNVRVAIPSDDVVAGTWVIVNNFVPDTSVIAAPNCPGGVGVAVDGAGLNLMAVQINTTTSSPQDADIENIKLVWDVNVNGLWDPLLDLVLQEKPGSALLEPGGALFYNGPQEPLAFLSNSAGRCVFIGIGDVAPAVGIGPTNGTNSRLPAATNGCYISLIAVVEIGPTPINRTKFGLQMKAYSGDIPGTTGISSFTMSSGFSSSRNPQASNATVDIFGGLPGPDAAFEHLNNGLGNPESTFTALNFIGGDNNEGLKSRFRTPEVTFGTREAIIYAGALCDGGFLANANVPMLPAIAGAPPTIAGGLASLPCVASAGTDGLLTGVIEVIMKIEVPPELIRSIGAIRMYSDLDCDGILFEVGELVQQRHPFYNEPTEELYVFFNREQGGPLFTALGPGLGGGCAVLGGLGSANASPFPRIIIWTADIHPQLAHVDSAASQSAAPLIHGQGSSSIWRMFTKVALNPNFDKSNFAGGATAGYLRSVSDCCADGDEPVKPPQERRKTQLAKYDENFDGRIDEDELNTANEDLANSHLSMSEFRDIEDAFFDKRRLPTGITDYDANDDAKISKIEVEKAFEDWQLGLIDRNLYLKVRDFNEENKRIQFDDVADFDFDKDGRVTEKEFGSANTLWRDRAISWDLKNEVFKNSFSRTKIPHSTKDYDHNNNGIIDSEEANQAEEDVRNLLIDKTLFQKVQDAWLDRTSVSGNTPRNEEQRSFKVNTEADGEDINLGDEVCDMDPGPAELCSVRAAFQEAGLFSGTTKIDVPNGTFGFPRGGVGFLGDIVLQGEGAANTIFDFSGSPQGFEFADGSLRVVGATIQNSEGPGILCEREGSVATQDVTIEGNNDWGVALMEGCHGAFDSTNFLNNLTPFSGAAVWCEEGGSLTISDSTFSGNSAGENGGAIGAAECPVILNNVIANSNHSGLAGGAFSATNGSVEITGSLFRQNTTDGNGGALNLENANLLLQGSSLFLNEAGLDGGAFYLASGSTSIDSSMDSLVDRSTFGSNIADRNGGAIVIASPNLSPDQDLFGQLRIEDASFSGNSADNKGGAVFKDRGSLDRVEIEGSSFEDNRSPSGSAISNDSDGPINAARNYWDSPNGPEPGIIVGDIIVQPFLTSPPDNIPTLPPFASSIDIPQISHIQSQVRANKIQFNLSGRGISSARIEIFDLTGKSVYKTSNMGQQLAWNMRNARGQQVANGVYLYVVTAYGTNGKFIHSEVKKLVVIR